jgi:D-lactate dehydrogenase (cytochrome)
MKTYTGQDYICREFPDMLYDESRCAGGVPNTVFFPETTADVCEILAATTAEKNKITIIAAQTGITGGAVPTDNCNAVCFKAMNRILRVSNDNPNHPVLHCQPGITLEGIAQFLDNPQTWPYMVEGASLLAPREWCYPPDPTELTAQLGGTVATNASGARSYYHKATRQHVSELSLVFANSTSATIVRGNTFEKNGIFSIITDQGTTLTLKKPEYAGLLIKNAAGYFSQPGMDIIDLFIGSEGTLALITEIGIRLSHTPRYVGGLSFFPTRKDAFAFADFLRTQKNSAAIEYFDKSVFTCIAQHKERFSAQLPKVAGNLLFAVYWEFIEHDNDIFDTHAEQWEEQLLACNSSFDTTISGFDSSEMAILKKFRHAVPELINGVIADYKKDCPLLRKIATDSALPACAFDNVIERSLSLVSEAGLDFVLFGHLGDFHLHLNMLPKNVAELDAALNTYEKLMYLALENGGTVSAEHGIGKIKKKYLAKMYSSLALAQMKQLKKQLDPDYILNPGNLFD